MRLPLLLTALTLPLQAIEFEGPREVTDFSSYYRQLLPADLDGDGDQDLLAAGFLSVTWYRNTGNGRFERAGYQDYVADASKIELADFDNDGLPDLLLHGRELDGQGVPITLQVHFSSGMTGFRGLATALPSQGDRYMVGDVDANGFADLVGSDRTFLNPSGPNSQTVARAVSADDIEVDQVYVRDVAGNSLPDLVKLSGEYWQNLGGGEFSNLKTLTLPEAPELAGKQAAGMIHLLRADANRLFVVAQMVDEEDRTKTELAFFSNTGGHLDLIDTLKVKPQGKQSSGWLAMGGSGFGGILGRYAMISSDGVLDDMRTAWISVSYKGGVEQAVAHTLASTGWDSTSAMLYHDMDGDGFKDLLLAGEPNYSDSSFLRMHRGKKGDQVNPKAEMIDAPGNNEVVKSLIDLDGDGDLDLVTEGWTVENLQGQIAWWENRGQGASFIRHVLITKKGTMEVVAAKDLNGDGRVEVIASSHAFKDGVGKEILISEATGGGGNRRVRTIKGHERKIDYPKQVELGDWDGDSIDDLLVWDYATVNEQPYSERVRWMKGRPGNRFAKPVFLGESDDQRLYDVDDDGDLDLAGYAGVEFAGQGWQEHINGGLAPRTFPAIAGVTKPLSPALADLDGDGRQDFVAGAVPVLAKAGGVFQALPAFAVEPSQEVRSWFADLDGDGDADGVIASVGDTTQLDLTENLGGGNFGPLESLGTLPARPYHPISVHAGDIDGDGKTDLVISTLGMRSRVEWRKRK